ncbi:selenoprotein domain containing protein [Grosmannia clavigera kw1407]|uniref:Selenoprotein domain containing protein n=1 Tax=Grosmannia clavigera (strain kw1407 / UAMH 11150) TaxID=655863 RepID=F0XQ18_GROCL|nr:selenoprotein domain containing protein [Grosmannia clavigera kw1407]EFX00548.1 selenoprotein domain containing protein [Grosmannia clavigera kw1407]
MDLPGLPAVKPPVSPVASAGTAPIPVQFPRVAIQFCTQCKWMLRAAYYAQELMSTFGTALGEVALQPATGGVFRVTIEQGTATGTDTASSPALLWDRSVDGGFPETKELKRRVRDVIAPGRDLGHVDRAAAKEAKSISASAPASESTAAATSPLTETRKNNMPAQVCEDCQ